MHGLQLKSSAQAVALGRLPIRGFAAQRLTLVASMLQT